MQAPTREEEPRAKNDEGETRHDGPKPKISIAGTVPAAEFNGLLDEAMLAQIVEHPHVRRRAVIEFDASDVNRVTDTRQRVPKIRIWQIEPLLENEQDQVARRWLDEAVKARPGQDAFDSASFDHPAHP